ncbi:hypothetical protein CPLU01_02505 [Colletotrichum plurivorum]|uniref:Uncharacterized protein n=1 Tax=Colletotrichum plurivorum TaxID=2175906 RepID=A0A8H6KW46_9PEZI|nr:hypothetical protein CPLU01_02505 [Colletotrichum plurivorum]
MIDVPVDNAKKLSSAGSEAPSMVDKYYVPQHREYATQYMRSRLLQMLGSRQWSAPDKEIREAEGTRDSDSHSLKPTGLARRSDDITRPE